MEKEFGLPSDKINESSILDFRLRDSTIFVKPLQGTLTNSNFLRSKGDLKLPEE
jgi:hypothetical protein